MTAVDADRSESSRGTDSPSGGRWEALSVPHYRVLFTSGTLVFLAVQGSSLARVWLARSSNSALGGVMFAFGIAMLLGSQFGGVVTDRTSKRLIIIWSNVVLLGTSIALGLAVQTDTIEYWMLLVTSAAQGLAFAFMGPARAAFSAELVAPSQLPNAIALSQVSLNVTKVVGPAIAGAMIGLGGTTGTASVYWASAVISVGAIAMTWRLPRGSVGGRRAGGSFVDGLRYVRAHAELRVVLLTSFVVVMIGFPYVTFLTRLVTDTFERDADSLGVLQTIGAVGAVIMTIFFANRMAGKAWGLQIQSGAAFGVGLILLGVVPTYLAAVPIVLLLGGANAVFQTANNTLALTISEPEYHGRVQSLMMLSFGAFGLAALPLGVLADTIGLGAMFVLCGVVVSGTIGLAVLWHLARRSSPSAQDGITP